MYTLNVKYDFDCFQICRRPRSWNRHEQQTQDISETMQALFGFPSYTLAGGGIGAGAQEETDLRIRSARRFGWRRTAQVASSGWEGFSSAGSIPTRRPNRIILASKISSARRI